MRGGPRSSPPLWPTLATTPATLVVKMEVFVYSRRALEAVQPHEVPHVIISITSGPEDMARLRRNEHCAGVLRLHFPDAAVASEQFPEAILFGPEHARDLGVRSSLSRRRARARAL
jgi:hypothetical protein